MENTRSKLTMQALPADCLEIIFNKVDDLVTQIHISKACAVFRDVISRIWRHNKAYHCVYFDGEFEAFGLGYDNFAYFLRNMHTAIRKIKVRAYPFESFFRDLAQIQIKCFPNVLAFKTIPDDIDSDIYDPCPFEDYADHLNGLEVRRMLNCFINDESEIYLLGKLLPNLQKLFLNTDLIARHIIIFNQLQELDLSNWCEDGKRYKLSRDLPIILKNLKQLKLLDIRHKNSEILDISSIEKGQNLQVLKLYTKDLRPVLKKVLKLPNLKKLYVSVYRRIETDDTRDFYYVLENKFDTITGIAIDNRSMHLNPHWDENLKVFQCKKLEKFAFIPFKDDLLKELVNIQQLTFLDLFEHNDVAKKLVNILVPCTKLECLNLRRNFRDIDAFIQFLNGVMHVLKSQKERKSLLTLQYLGLDYHYADIKKHPSYADWTSVMVLETFMYTEKMDDCFRGGYEINFK